MFTPKRSAVDLVNGERNAVERDRALGGDEAARLARALEREPDAVAVGRHARGSWRRPSTWPVRDGRRARRRSASARSRLMRRPGLPVAERGACQRLVGGIDGEDAAAGPSPSTSRWSGSSRRRRSRRLGRGCRVVRAGDDEARALAARLKRAYAADNAGEHGRYSPPMQVSIRSGPNERASNLGEMPARGDPIKTLG